MALLHVLQEVCRGWQGKTLLSCEQRESLLVLVALCVFQTGYLQVKVWLQFVLRAFYAKSFVTGAQSFRLPGK
jgi:hypothetical protein